MESIADRRQWADDLGSQKNSWTVDYLPKWTRKVGSAVKGALKGVWTRGAAFFADHPVFKKITVVLLVTGVVVGGSFLIQAAPHLIHSRFIQGIAHSSAASAGKAVYFWGKGLFEEGKQLVPVLGGAVAIFGTLDLLFVPGKRLWSSTNMTILTLGLMTTGAIGVGTIASR